MNNFSQEQVFLFFFIIGIIEGLIFDVFKVLRKSFKTSDTVTFIEDLIFILFSGILIISSIIKLNGGEIRFFLFLGIFFGITIYILTISNLCVIILYEFVKICKKIFKIPYYCIKKIFFLSKKLLKNIQKSFKKDF